MWCPECGREYREGFTECAYCHVALTENEPEIDEDTGEVVHKEPLEEQPDYEAMKEAIMNDPELMKELKEGADAFEEAEKRRVLRFRTAEERVNDMKTSGVTLSVLGVLGLIVVVLLFTGVIKINLYGVGSYITYATMSVLFLIFTVAGFRALAMIKPLTEEAEREADKIKEIEEWFYGEYNGDKIDSGRKREADEGFDDVYYGRVAFMREKINRRFMDLDPAFTDHVIERLYQKLFDDEAEADGEEADGAETAETEVDEA